MNEDSKWLRTFATVHPVSGEEHKEALETIDKIERELAEERDEVRQWMRIAQKYRKAIEDAPHAEHCTISTQPYEGQWPFKCDCWKSEVSKDE